MSKHTRKLRAGRSGDFGNLYDAETGRCVAQVNTLHQHSRFCDPPVPVSRIEADLNLFEAAPELLEFLKKLQKQDRCDADQINETHSEDCEGCEINRLIAKAEGR